MPGKSVMTDDEYAGLAVKDLLEARDQYHLHLMNKANVVGTAIGRYLNHPLGRAIGATRTACPQPSDRGPTAAPSPVIQSPVH